MKETHVELCCCGAWFATDTFALKARAEEVAAFREAHKVCRERHVKGIPSKPPAGDRTAGSMSRFKLTGMEKVRTWIEDSPPPIFGPDRDDVLAALERIQAQLEAARASARSAERDFEACEAERDAAVEAITDYVLAVNENRDSDVYFDRLAVLAGQEKQPG